jgi:hypothetical protein
MASRPDGKSKTLSSGLSPDEERVMIHESLDRHYMSLLDQPVPSLGDITPLKAAKSAKGRERLVVWLKYLENNSAKHGKRSPMADYDFGWLWEKLDIAELRR